MKKFLITLILVTTLVLGVSAYADIIKIGEMREYVGEFESNLVLAMEGLVDWYPTNEGEFSAEISEEYAKGVKDSGSLKEYNINSDLYTIEYFYNPELDTLMQMCYKGNGNVAYVLWDGNYTVVDYMF